MLEPMEDSVHIQTMLPNKTANARIFGEHFIGPVILLIVSAKAKDVNIILEVWGNLGFILQDEGDIILEYSG
jgi:hypothetical protein